MFVIGLIGMSAAFKKGLARLLIFRRVASVVVIDLVIVPRDDPGKGRVRELQIGIAFVERIAIAVVFERVVGTT